VVLVGGKRGHAEWVDDYVACYNHLGMQNRSKKMPISHVVELTLHIVLINIMWVVESIGLPFASRRQLDYVVIIMSPTIYNWCVIVLENMKD
jgi:hypothetical protein